MQGLHMRDMLGYDDDGADEYGVNDIDITRMDGETHQHQQWLSTGGSQYLHAVITEFHDIFSHSVKVNAMDVPPVDRTQWETNLNHAVSSYIYWETWRIEYLGG